MHSLIVGGGYPACAGIDPKRALPIDLRVGLPRMRGDRPRHTASLLREAQATPHARGSTLGRRERHDAPGGYPACAGIDLCLRGHTAHHLRLPRMRGDRPIRIPSVRDSRPATPHARGSTLVFRFFSGCGEGYPACAGIDPAKIAGSAIDSRLPRMRGDRPAKLAVTVSGTTATPHARGSTRGMRPKPVCRYGYPACAGIDPCDAGMTGSGRRLPRMRGDRPAWLIWSTWSSWATPHARGSTLSLRR